MVNTLKSLLKDPGFLLKLLELVLFTVAFFLWDEEFLRLETFNNIVLSLLVLGYWVITVCFILAYVFEKTHHVMEPGLMLVGAVLSFIASGTLMVEWMEETHERHRLPPYTFFVMVPIGVVMLADTIREVIICRGLQRAASRIQ